MDAFIAGAWRTPTRGEVQVGGAWKRLTRAEAYIGGQWRTVLSFTPAMTASINPTSTTETVNPPYPTVATAVSGVITATPAGGTAPYSYAWTVLSGGPASFSNASAASTAVIAVLGAEESRSITVQVTITDANGSTATATANATLTNSSFA